MTKNMIYNESCLDTMGRMPDDYCDLILTSPPYNMNLRVRNGQYCSRQLVEELTTKYANFSDNLPIEEYYQFHKKVIEGMLRVCPLIFYNVQFLTGNKQALYRLIGDFHDKIKEFIVWDKEVAQPAIRDKVLNSQWEAILVFDKYDAINRRFNKANFSRGTLSNLWKIKRGKKVSKDHGATFPEELAEKIIANFTNFGDTVYDPFSGLATTNYVAQKLGRYYIGSEIDKEYYEFGNQRLLKT
jgi:site-specific DNA-methyltransferase (adenine-specific)/modification methylase